VSRNLVGPGVAKTNGDMSWLDMTLTEVLSLIISKFKLRRK